MSQKTIPHKLPFWFTYGTLGIFCMLLGLLMVTLISYNNSYHNTIAGISGLIRLDVQTSRYLLKNGLPFLDHTTGEDDPFTLFNIDWAEIYWKFAANIKNASPREILRAQLPLLALTKPKPLIIPPDLQPIEPPELVEPPKIIPILPKMPEILLFHTHTTESYLPVSGKDHSRNIKGDITLVGEHLQKILEEKYGIKTLHNEKIHDSYPFRDSYKRSNITVSNYLKENPSLKVILDIHRDATPGVEQVCTIKNQKTAKILLVVGSDRMGLTHPHWHKNLKFANKLTEAMNLYYPGLSNGIVTSNARYNQHLSEHALIVEIGDQHTNLAEANYAVELFAEVLMSVWTEEFKEKFDKSQNNE